MTGEAGWGLQPPPGHPFLGLESTWGHLSRLPGGRRRPEPFLGARLCLEQAAPQMKWRDLGLMERTSSPLGSGQGPHKAGGADRQVESPGSQGQSPPSEHFLDNFCPPPPLPNHLEPGQSPTLGFPACPGPLGRDTPSGLFPEPRRAERVPEADSGVPLGSGEMGRALFALISGEDVERGGPVPGPHCMGVTPPPGTLQCSPTTSPCAHRPLHPLVHAGNTSFLLGTL